MTIWQVAPWALIFFISTLHHLIGLAPLSLDPSQMLVALALLANFGFTYPWLLLALAYRHRVRAALKREQPLLQLPLIRLLLGLAGLGGITWHLFHLYRVGMQKSISVPRNGLLHSAQVADPLPENHLEILDAQGLSQPCAQPSSCWHPIEAATQLRIQSGPLKLLLNLAEGSIANVQSFWRHPNDSITQSKDLWTDLQAGTTLCPQSSAQWIFRSDGSDLAQTVTPVFTDWQWERSTEGLLILKLRALLKNQAGESVELTKQIGFTKEAFDFQVIHQLHHLGTVASQAQLVQLWQIDGDRKDLQNLKFAPPQLLSYGKAPDPSPFRFWSRSRQTEALFQSSLPIKNPHDHVSESEGWLGLVQRPWAWLIHVEGSDHRWGWVSAPSPDSPKRLSMTLAMAPITLQPQTHAQLSWLQHVGPLERAWVAGQGGSIASNLEPLAGSLRHRIWIKLHTLLEALLPGPIRGISYLLEGLLFYLMLICPLRLLQSWALRRALAPLARTAEILAMILDLLSFFWMSGLYRATLVTWRQPLLWIESLSDQDGSGLLRFFWWLTSRWKPPSALKAKEKRGSVGVGSASSFAFWFVSSAFLMECWSQGAWSSLHPAAQGSVRRILLTSGVSWLMNAQSAQAHPHAALAANVDTFYSGCAPVALSYLTYNYLGHLMPSTLLLFQIGRNLAEAAAQKLSPAPKRR